MARFAAPNTKRSNLSRNVRPTSGKVLLALFNILNSMGYVAGCRFLDLFAGTGDVSAEAIRRGAAHVLAVESDKNMACGISSRFGSIGSGGSAEVFRSDVRRAVPKLALECEADAALKFDVVFADPPYCLGWGSTLPGLIENNSSILSKRGVFVFEHSVREKAAEMSSQVFLRDDRIYGDTALTLYRRAAEEADGGSGF